ncbi:MAG: primase [Solirubrobacteraceae bacterium]|nr:primase [Solirubrobacteraceae bacterium]
MTRYTDDSKERVRDAVDMVDLVGSRTELRRAGVNRYEGLCPFHDERSPSFGIDPTQKLFYCFGCSEGGDAFRFVQMTEGVDFKGSLVYLADRYGVTLEAAEEDPATAERRRSRERLLELLERTAAFYVRYLWDSEEAAPAREYLASRGLDEGALREFRVGYAPSAFDTLLHAVRRGGFTNRETFDAGLAVRAKGEGMLYDRFRRRIMFPLCDLRGRVLGFGARALGADQKPKYLNSADNTVYHKGRHLFGADIARAHATKAGSVIVAEGYTDVIAMHQAGLRNTVGLMGTALTEEQVGELARLAPRVQLALDADGAGQEAMLRAARVAAGRRLELRVVPLPAGADPADLVQAEGARAVQHLVDASVPFVRFRVERELERDDLSSAEGKDRVITALRPVFAQIPPSALREELVALVADRTDLAPALAASWLSQPGGEGAGGRGGGGGGGRGTGGNGPAGPGRAPEATSGDRAPRTPMPLDVTARAEREFLAQCVSLPSAGAAALAAVDLDDTFTSELTRRAARHLRAHLQSPTDGLDPEDTELATLIAQLAVRGAQRGGSPAALEGASLNLELVHVERAIATARSAGEGIAPLVTRRAELRGRRDRAIERAMAESQPVE